MTISRVTRVSNPRKRATSSKRRKSNPKRLSLKQKLHFGSARQRAAAKASLSRKRKTKRPAAAKTHRRRTVAKANPVRRRKRRASNPAHMITLGLVNPSPRRAKTTRRKKTSMATKTKRRTRRAASNPRRRRRNSVRVIVRRARRRRVAAASNPVRRRASRRRSNPRRRHHSIRRRSNPSLFGRSVGSFEMVKAIAGGLAGVAITKAVPNMLPASLTSSSPWMGVLVSAGVAFGAGMLAKTLIKGDSTIGDAIMFGGFMQAGSMAINIAAPSVGTVIGLHGLGNGVGDLVAGRFPVPMNPIMAGQQQLMLPPPPMPSAGGAPSGVGAIFNPYGRAM